MAIALRCAPCVTFDVGPRMCNVCSVCVCVCGIGCDGRCYVVLCGDVYECFIIQASGAGRPTSPTFVTRVCVAGA